jgi:hypothetical protein
MNIEELEKRLRDVEGYIKMLIGGAAVLAVCVLAFLGIEYWRVPAAVHSAISERIDHTTLERITSANALAESLLKNADNKWDPAKQAGFTVLGDTLICYGTANLQYKGSGHTCPFEFPFPKEFATSPAISQSVRAEGNGLTYAVWHHTLTAAGYAGTVTEGQGRDSAIPVTMSYIAIGKPK